MKKNFTCFLLTALLTCFIADAQNVGINNDGSSPDISAMLDIKSSTKGVLIPRIALAGTGDVTTVASPQTSLLVYNTATAGTGNTAVEPGYYYWNGTAWTKILSGNNTSVAWSRNGNAGTVPGTDFIGTTDNKSLQFKVNNQLAGNIDIVQVNTFFGYGAGKSLTSGYGNIAFGQYALSNLTSGFDNLAIGEGTLGQTVIGAGNVAVGKFALSNNTESSNTAVGRTALTNSTTGYENTALGRSALFSNTTGFQNTAIGRNALVTNTTGNLNTAIGFGADVAAANLTNATVIGANAYANCSNCIVLGAVQNVNNAASSVKVGIGTNNPAASLDVRRTGNITANFYGSKWITHLNWGTEENTFIRGGKDSANVLINDDPALGNVGIGTGTPAYKLDVNGDIRGSVLRQTNAIGQKIVLFPTSPDVYYGIGIQGNLLQIHTDIEASDVAFGYGSSSNFTEKVRIKGNGRIGIGTNDPTASLDVRRTTNTTANFYGSAVISHFNFGDQEHTYIRGGKAGANVLINDFAGAGNVGIGTSAPGAKLDVAGTIRCTNLVQTSDARLKTNITRMGSSLQSLSKLSGYRYQWKDRMMDQSIQIGLLAQEVQQVFPELVHTDIKGNLAVNYQGLVPVMIEAIKELKKENEELKKMKDELEELKRIIYSRK